MMPQTVDKDIADRCIDKTTNEVLDIVDVEEGFDVEFTREGSGVNTRYMGINVARRASPVCADEDKAEQWLDFIEENPLTNVFNEYSAEHIERIFRGASASSTSTPRRAQPQQQQQSGGEKLNDEPDADVPWFTGDEDSDEAPADSANADSEGNGSSRLGGLKERLAAKKQQS
jgi:hypothetical protein